MIARYTMRIVSMSLLSLFLFTIAGAQNLLSNGGFEIWSGGIPQHWSISGSGLNTEEENTIIHGGTSSCKLTWTTTSTRWIQQEVPVNEGASYTFSFWAYDNDPFGRIRVYMRWYDGSGNRISNSEGSYSIDGTDWQQLSLTASAPATAETIHVEVRVYDVSWGDSITSSSAYVDDALLTGGGGDVTAPTVVSVFSWGQDTIEVVFDEAVDSLSAENLSNYTIDNSLTISDAQLDDFDPTLIRLTTSSQENIFYTLIVTGVDDTSFNTMSADTSSFWGGISTIEFARADDDSDFVPDKKGDIITIEGISTVEWYIISPSATFLQDYTGGINIHTPGYDPQISRGDIARVAGEVAQYTGTTEISNVVRFEILGQDVVPYPTSILLSDFGEDLEGSLVRVENVYSAGGDPWPESGNSANILITNESGSDTATLRIYYMTDIDGSPEPLWPVDIVGIMDQYDNSSPYDSNYQILARDMGDLSSVAIEEAVCPLNLVLIENPLSHNTLISFAIRRDCDVSLKVYNVLGQEVTELINSRLTSGEYRVCWNIETIKIGVYFLRLATGNTVDTKKVVVLR